MKKIGIMGGTFNPIHNGHLALAKAAKKKFKLDRIIFIPSGTPPHKKGQKVIGKEARYEMVKLAIQGIKDYSVSRLELDRPGPSYAVDTFRALQKKYGAETKLFYIMGLDSLNDVLTWHKPEELSKLCEIIVASRRVERLEKSMVKGGLSNQPLTNYHSSRPTDQPKPLGLSSRPTHQPSFYFHNLKLDEDVSSSNIRKRIKAGKSVSRLVPKIVESYIKRKGLYR